MFFAVDLAAARELLGPTGVEPWPFFGKALAALYAWNYRDSTVGSYNEVGLGIQARRPGTKPSVTRLAMDMLAQPDQGIWVASLPVTTEEACRAGVEIWGYPKYVTPIETKIEASGGYVRLGDELELRVPKPTVFRKNLPIATYTKLGEKLIRTEIKVSSNVGLATSGSLSLLSNREGPTAKIASALQLSSARVIGGFLSEEFKAVLPEGTSVM